MSIPQTLLPFHLIEDASKVLTTSLGGLPLVVETFRALGLRQSIRRHLSIQQRSGQFEEADYIEAFVAVFAAGGDCLEDFEILRGDNALGRLGLRVPSPESARFFLNAFHEEEPLAARRPGQALIPPSTAPLKHLEQVHRDSIRKAAQRDQPWIATLDMDASVIPSDKQEAFFTYSGGKGYQPVIVYWAEQDLIIADEFRDGNVPARMGLLQVLKQAIQNLPPGIRQIRLRSDSAAYTQDLLDWCRQEVGGRPRVEFAISAEMTPQLRAAIGTLPEAAWKPLRKVNDRGWVFGRKEWTEVEFIPTKPSCHKNLKPDRYLAIRLRPAQDELFADGQPYHYFAIVSNMWNWEGERLLRWQRERCGTVEQVIDVLKNDLAAGTLPCKRFFANATWFRLNVLTYNVLTVMKKQSLPLSWARARLKALRFRLLRLAARVVVHGRRIFLKLAQGHPSFPIYAQARLKLRGFSSA